MSELVTIFRTHSNVEATIVRGLLEANGVRTVTSSPVSHSVFPFTVNELAEVKISVRPQDADEALRIIESHRMNLSGNRVVPIRDEFEALERAIDYRFRDRGLLEQALTHTSRAHEDASGGVTDNESLEFLGDAVLGFIVADFMFREFPSFTEGQKSKMKAALVSASTLSRLAEGLRLGDHLLLGRGEERSGGRRKQALLADGYEALIAAIYLDGGVEQARAFLVRELGPFVAEMRERGAVGHDHKSALQEFLQSHDRGLPEYRLTGTAGPDHRKMFRVEVVVSGSAVAKGEGPSKKEAEQEAARIALGILRQEG
jgi:ribonuclease-3